MGNEFCDNKIFCLKELGPQFLHFVRGSEGNLTQKNYFAFKITSFKIENQETTMVQVMDISKSICYDLQKADNQFLSLINGCISHELRNPLNALQAQTMKKEELYAKLNGLIGNLEKMNKKVKLYI